MHFNIGRSAGWNRSSAARGSHGSSHRRSSSIGSDSDGEGSVASTAAAPGARVRGGGMEWDSAKARERDMIGGITEGFLVRISPAPTRSVGESNDQLIVLSGEFCLPCHRLIAWPSLFFFV
jgi:hypothetical protein